MNLITCQRFATGNHVPRPWTGRPPRSHADHAVRRTPSHSGGSESRPGFRYRFLLHRNQQTTGMRASEAVASKRLTLSSDTRKRHRSPSHRRSADPNPTGACAAASAVGSECRPTLERRDRRAIVGGPDVSRLGPRGKTIAIDDRFPNPSIGRVRTRLRRQARPKSMSQGPTKRSTLAQRSSAGRGTGLGQCRGQLSELARLISFEYRSSSSSPAALRVCPSGLAP